ncbi:MAG: hypothetical protein ACRENE_07225 [Polyangiaceae bacterium]
MRWGSDGRRRVARGGAAVLASVLLAVGTAGQEAFAADSTDTSYGRVQGDLTAVVGAGATVADGGPRGAAEVRLRYLETAGLFGSYEDGPLLGSQAEPRRVVATGLEVRPLFLFRWLKGHETSRAALDLMLDSIGLELGAFFEQPAGTSFESRPGLQLGLMLEFPLFARATGPWAAVHGGVRWSDAALAGGPTDSPDDRSLYLSITLAWHQVVLSSAVDVGDRPAD